MDQKKDVDSVRRFRQAFGAFEDAIKQAAGRKGHYDIASLIDQLSKEYPSVNRNNRFLHSCRRLRNSMSHGTNPILQLDLAYIERLERIVSTLTDPVRLMDIAVPRQNVFTASFDDKISDVVKTMKRRGYSHVPVMAGQKVDGVFSENTLFAALAADQDTFTVSKDMTLSALEPFIHFDGRSKRREKFEFVSRNTSLDEVEKLISSYLERRDRLSLLFVTQNGRTSEKLLGIATIWDVAGAEKNL